MRFLGAACALVVCLPGVARAQVSLTGTYVTYVAVGSNGAMVDSSTARSVAYTETGSLPATCDFYYPGSPWEGFEIDATDTMGRSMTAVNNAPFATGFATTAGPTVTGRDITWSGSYASGGFTITLAETYTLQSDDRSVQVTMVVTNGGTSTLDLYYKRQTDPDQGSCTGPYDTDNDVLLAPPADSYALITSGQSTAAGYMVVGMAAQDARARGSLGTGSGSAATEWASPTDPGGASADSYVDLVFHEAALAPGASTTFTMYFVFGPDTMTVQTRTMGLGTVPCAGADGSACTGVAGAAGTCHALRCCTGCWDGTRCNPPGTATACGIGGGACAACDDGDACSTDTCTAATGACAHPAAPMGTACNDGLFCTATDLCDGADHCIGGGAPCDDGNPCTAESCSETTHACSGHTPLPDGAACTAFPPGVCHGGACCSGCWNGTSCQAGTSPTVCGTAGAACASCTDGDQCTDDVCTVGACSNPFSPPSRTCTDGLYCTTGDHCDGADTCAGGAASPCDDGSICTSDTCDEASDSCSHAAAAGICAIFGSCFMAGTVNPSNRCQVCDPTTSATAWSTAVGMDCGTPVCAAGMLTPSPTCSATGMCVTGTRAPCPSGACADGTMCATMCATDAGCGPSGYCDTTTGMCATRVPSGAPCDHDAMCALGVCSADHHCCGTVCDVPCRSCAVPGSEGHCVPVPMGTDPDGECAAGLTCTLTGNCGTNMDAGTPDAGTGTPVDLGTPPIDMSTPVDGGIVAHPDAGTTRARGGCCGVAGSSGGDGLAVLVLLGLALAGATRRRSRG